MPSQEELDNFEAEDLGEVVSVLLTGPLMYKVWRDAYLDCNDQSVLDEVDTMSVNNNPMHVRKELKYVVNNYTWIVLRNGILEDRARRQQWVRDHNAEFNAKWAKKEQSE